MPGEPAPITGLPRFVTMRGGDYFFVPSFTALKAMRDGSRFEVTDFGSVPESAGTVAQPDITVATTTKSGAAERRNRLVKICSISTFLSGLKQTVHPSLRRRRRAGIRRIRCLVIQELADQIFEQHG